MLGIGPKTWASLCLWHCSWRPCTSAFRGVKSGAGVQHGVRLHQVDELAKHHQDHVPGQSLAGCVPNSCMAAAFRARSMLAMPLVQEFQQEDIP